MTNKVFVGSMSLDTTEANLKELFSQIGNVLVTKVIVDRYTGESKGYGFVEMSTEGEAQAAMTEFNGTQLNGRTIVVKEAKTQIAQ